jgi:SAM-dependent methyltransferase
MVSQVDYYDKIWSSIGGYIPENDRERITVILKSIPDECNNVLDVGCGDGRITNLINLPKENITGLDLSAKALEHVTTKTVCASADCLPFDDKSFDILLCNETLEHLSYQGYPKTLSELSRVASKYILVSFPYNQDLRQRMVKCPYCGCQFVPARHVRSFNQRIIATLFENFSVLHQYPVGPWYKNYGSTLITVAKMMGVSPKWAKESVCPQCNYNELETWHIPSAENKKSSPFLTRLISKTARTVFPGKKKPTYMVVLYKRKNS